MGALTLRASAVDLEGVKYATPGAMHSVEFFAGNCSLGQDMGNKGNFSVSTSLLAENGTYYLTAVATDVDGNRVTSDAVLIHVGNRPPVVAFVSPAPGDNIESGSIELVANATDADGSVSKVEFFLEGTSLGIAARSHGSPTYKINWTLQANGPSLLTVIATDDAGTSASAVVGITVGATLTTSPLAATRDATIRESSPAANSNWADNVYGKPGGRNVALHQFDMAAPKALQHELRSAALKLYATGDRNLPGRFALYGTSGAQNANWQETTVTWSTAPIRGNKLSTEVISSKGRWFSWDVTHYVAKQWTSAENLITFWLEDDELDWNKVTFESRREGNANPPELVIVTSSMAAPASTGLARSAPDCSVESAPEAELMPMSEVGTSTTTSTTSVTTTVMTTTSDPSTLCGIMNSARVMPSADTSLQEGSPSASGNWGNIEVYGKPGNKMIVALLRFTLPSTTAPIQMAVLKLYCVVARNVPGVVTIFSAGNDWDEASVNWNTRPARGTRVASFTVASLSEDHYTGDGDAVGYYRVDVTDLVLETKAASESTLTFWLEDEALEYLALKFESRRDDKAFPPLLEIATGEACSITLSGHLQVSVPNVLAFLADDVAKKAVCDGIEAECGAPVASATCTFSEAMAAIEVYFGTLSYAVGFYRTNYSKNSRITMSIRQYPR